MGGGRRTRTTWKASGCDSPHMLVSLRSPMTQMHHPLCVHADIDQNKPSAVSFITHIKQVPKHPAVPVQLRLYENFLNYCLRIWDLPAGRCCCKINLMFHPVHDSTTFYITVCVTVIYILYHCVSSGYVGFYPYPGTHCIVTLNHRRTGIKLWIFSGFSQDNV
jgi:hypothetical protein